MSHDNDFQEHDETAFADGEPDRVEEFRFDLVDQNLSGGNVQPTESRPNHYRAAALKFFPFLDQVLAFVIEYDNPRLAAWVIAIAAGRISLTEGITQRQLADKFGVTKAAVSKCVKTVQARFGNSIAGIEPMPGQRAKESCRKFAEIRHGQINNHTTKAK